MNLNICMLVGLRYHIFCTHPPYPYKLFPWARHYVGIRKVMYQAGNWQCLPDKVTMSILGNIGAPTASTPIGCYASLSGKGHYGGMMHGDSGSKIEGRGTGGGNCYNRQICTLINHGNCWHPVAAMGPHSWLLSIQQSANILCNRTT